MKKFILPLLSLFVLMSCDKALEPDQSVSNSVSYSVVDEYTFPTVSSESFTVGVTNPYGNHYTFTFTSTDNMRTSFNVPVDLTWNEDGTANIQNIGDTELRKSPFDYNMFYFSLERSSIVKDEFNRITFKFVGTAKYCPDLEEPVIYWKYTDFTLAPSTTVLLGSTSTSYSYDIPNEAPYNFKEVYNNIWSAEVENMKLDYNDGVFTVDFYPRNAPINVSRLMVTIDLNDFEKTSIDLENTGRVSARYGKAHIKFVWLGTGYEDDYRISDLDFFVDPADASFAAFLVNGYNFDVDIRNSRKKIDLTRIL